jgi:glycosyltransferase involved in cell wall biosynthesis
MRLILLTHPASLGSESMPRFASMIHRAMAARGHEVLIWTSPQRLGGPFARSAFARKWVGYLDQFLIFPAKLKKMVEQQSNDTLFIVTDQALGMWVPVLAHRPHVVHCHDFFALQSAQGEFPEYSPGWMGRQYQRLIRNGFSHGRAFISVSRKSREDLHRYLPTVPPISEVVYNGLNYPFVPLERAKRISLLKGTGVEVPEGGFIVHVGGNQVYKNRRGVLDIYNAYATASPKPLALWMVGAPPTRELSNQVSAMRHLGKVQFLSGLTNEQVNAAYSHARALLFPSLQEGFGWPIIEAMASGCPVITTDLAPMTEVAGDAGRLIPRTPANEAEREAWAVSAAARLDELVNLNGSSRQNLLDQGRLNAARFDSETAIGAYERLYTKTMADWSRQ